MAFAHHSEGFPPYRSQEVLTMPGTDRVVIADVAHHVTQRGNGRQFLAQRETESELYAIRRSTGTRRPLGTREGGRHA